MTTPDFRAAQRRRCSSVGTRRRRRWAWSGVSILLILLVGAIAWVAARGFQAKAELDAAVPLIEQVQTQVTSRDVAAATATAQTLSRHTKTAASLTSDPVWRLFEMTPWLGENLRSVRVLASAADEVASQAILPLARASASLDLSAFVPSEGRIDVQPIVDLQPPVGEAAAAIRRANAMLTEEGPDSATLIAPVSAAREQFSTMLDEAGSLVITLDRAVRLVPAMLGAEGVRDTLVLFQNPAELRSTGGITGALALVRTEDGAFTLSRQASSSDFPRFDPPVVELPVDTRALWGDNTARYIQDVNFTPQFPLAASIAKEMWQRQFGGSISTVVAIDPVALSYLLEATGPISLPTGDVLSSDNAVSLLLTDVYARYDEPAQQDAFFAAATSAVVGAVSSGGLDARKLIEALLRGSDERRILVWAAEPAEQALLSNTSLAGELPASGAAQQAFGVYFNDMTAAKMDPYLDVKIASGARVCRNDGLPTYEIGVSMTNTAPLDAAATLPPYVTGAGAYGTPPGSISTSVHVYSSAGTYNLGVTQGGQPIAYHPTSDSGYTLSRVEVELAPGESAEWRFSFLGSEPVLREPVIQSTPMIYKSEVSQLALSCD